MRTLSSRISVLLFASIDLAAIGLLWANRPSLPAIVLPTTASDANTLLKFLAWLGLLALAIGGLERIARYRHPPATMPLPVRHLHRPQPRTHRRPDGHDYLVSAFPLIPREPLIVAGPVAPSHAIETPSDAAPLPTAVTVSISLLGPVAIGGVTTRVRGMRANTKELLCHLALHSHGAHRDQIIDALWPDQPPEEGRKRLWRAVADARAHLGETALIREDEGYQLNRGQVTVDLDVLERLLLDIAETDDAQRRLRLLEEALGLFRGQPLAGSDYAWADSEQRRLEAINVDLFEHTAQALLAQGEPSGALTAAERGLAIETTNERLGRLAMRAEAALGLRTSVIDRYDKLSQLLNERLGLQPDSETRHLYRELLGQDEASAREQSGVV